MAVEFVKITRELGVGPDGELSNRFIIQVATSDIGVTTENGQAPEAQPPTFDEVADFMSRALIDFIRAHGKGEPFTKIG